MESDVYVANIFPSPGWGRSMPGGPRAREPPGGHAPRAFTCHLAPPATSLVPARRGGRVVAYRDRLRPGRQSAGARPRERRRKGSRCCLFPVHASLCGVRTGPRAQVVVEQTSDLHTTLRGPPTRSPVAVYMAGVPVMHAPRLRGVPGCLRLFYPDRLNGLRGLALADRKPRRTHGPPVPELEYGAAVGIFFSFF